MKNLQAHSSRRTFLKASGSALGLGAVGLNPFSALAENFPERTINIVVPTRQGGGADRDVRSFNAVWAKHLNGTFKYDFFPGASGQVGYEVYLGKRDPDAYNLLFGNMGPEVIMYALQKPNYKFPGDYYYFTQISSEHMCIFTGANSKIKTIEQLVDEGKKRTVNIAVSRLPHPASIGTLSLGEATGAKFNLVPYGGGGPSSRAALSGETDAVALPIAQPVKLGDKARTLVVFANKNIVAEHTNNAPVVNDVFGTKIPPLASSRAFGIHAAALDKYPERVNILKRTMKATMEDPAYAEAVEKSGLPTAFIDYGDQETSMQFAQSMLELASKYAPLLTGKKKS